MTEYLSSIDKVREYHGFEPRALDAPSKPHLHEGHLYIKYGKAFRIHDTKWKAAQGITAFVLTLLSLLLLPLVFKSYYQLVGKLWRQCSTGKEKLSLYIIQEPKTSSSSSSSGPSGNVDDEEPNVETSHDGIEIDAKGGERNLLRLSPRRTNKDQINLDFNAGTSSASGSADSDDESSPHEAKSSDELFDQEGSPARFSPRTPIKDQIDIDLTNVDLDGFLANWNASSRPESSAAAPGHWSNTESSSYSTGSSISGTGSSTSGTESSEETESADTATYSPKIPRRSIEGTHNTNDKYTSDSMAGNSDADTVSYAQKIPKRSAEEAQKATNDKYTPDYVATHNQKNKELAALAQLKEKDKNFAYHKGEIAAKLCNKPFVSKEEKIGRWLAGISSAEGKRSGMEDTDIAVEGSVVIDDRTYPFEFFGVFDGHGGTATSQAVKEQIINVLKTELMKQQGVTEAHLWCALKDTCEQVDQLNIAHKKVGSCGAMALILDDKLCVFNVGDSRIFFVNSKGDTIQATEDAKPLSDNPDEINRYRRKIEARGGGVCMLPGWYGRVGGDLLVARSFGDHRHTSELGKFVVANPKIDIYPLEECIGGYMVITCDGVYEVASTNEAGQAVWEMHEAGMGPQEISQRLVEGAFNCGSKDNLSVIVARLE